MKHFATFIIASTVILYAACFYLALPFFPEVTRVLKGD